MLNNHFVGTDKISYHYINQTQQVQIVRIQIGFTEWIERAVFPENHFDFDAPIDAQLEIYSHAIATSVLSDRIPCQQLLVGV